MIRTPTQASLSGDSGAGTRFRSLSRLAIAGVAGVATIAALVGCAPSDEAETPTSITVANSIAYDPDPFNGGHLFGIVNQAFYDPIIMVPAEGVDPQPWLAKSWDIAEDGMSITFQLRDDVDFVDGTHMDAPGLEKYFTALFASDKYTWKGRIVDQGGTTVEAVDEYSLRFNFSKEPVSGAWLWQFSLTPVASPATVGVANAFADGPVGTGPYVIKEETTGVSVTLERRDGYFQPEKYPYDEMTITQFEDEVAALNALKSGQLDATTLSLKLASEAESSGFRINKGWGTVPSLYIDDHNGKIDPAWGDLRVRQAISYAFDRVSINDAIYQGFGAISSQPFSPGQPEYVEGADDDYAFDLDKSMELLAEAGYPDGLNVDITIPTLAGVTDEMEPIVQQTLGELGIRVTYEPRIDIYDLIGVWNEGKYPVYIFPMPATNWVVAFDEWWGGEQPQIANPRGYQPEDTEWISLVENYRSKNPGDPDGLNAAAQEIGKYLTEQVWYIPIAKPYAVVASVENLQVEIPGFYPRVNLWEYTPAS